MIGECVIPAAGASSRMGAWKPLLPFGKSTIIETVVDAALSAGLRVVLVIGFRGDELASMFADKSGVECVRNPEWEHGLFGSILTGAEACSGEAVFLMNGDKPFVRSVTYGLLLSEYSRRSAAGLPRVPLFASFRGRAGHPVLVERKTVLSGNNVRDADATVRMRDHLAGFGPVLVECGDEGVLIDIDTPEDYERLRRMDGNSSI